MRSLSALFIACLTLFCAPAAAQVLSVETYVEEWDAGTQSWVRVGDTVDDGAERFVAVQRAQPSLSVRTYGPFRVIDKRRAEMVGVTNRASPRQFAAMLADYPQLETLALVDAPGTDDDRANLAVGRMIRAAGLETYVPAGGSVRSGAVELFLAGNTRRIDDGAEFAVHSWRDIYGRQPQDFPMSAPENRIYLDYYQEMGMNADEARAFYDMTNSVAFTDAKWLTAQDMRGWLGAGGVMQQPVLEDGFVQQETPKIDAAPVLAYLDLDTLVP
ncbi:alpha/beta hydrolase [Pontixanthobacter sp.]|uniref:alpha/beta hydrolase n=1 Tax=Pontixanthobacter sp. TaxID=2792078 RepID=UPI003C7DEDA9